MLDIGTLKSEKRYKILSLRFLQGRSVKRIAKDLDLPQVMVDEYLNSETVKRLRGKDKVVLKELTRGFSYVLIDENHPDRREYGI